MVEATLVFLAGAGIFALGVLQQPFYDIGAVVIVVGLVGIAVRLGTWLRWVLSLLNPGDPLK